MPYGILVNSAAILTGGLAGALLKDHFPERLKETLPFAFGLSAVTIDVYKRQAAVLRGEVDAIILTGGISHDPVSYTHLDVYKRQACRTVWI